MYKRVGRPMQNTSSTEQCDEAAHSLRQTAQRLREEFEGMPPKKQRETVELVERCLDDERRDILARRRRAPSPLARLAEQVYGIPVPWAPSTSQRTEPIEVSR
jgi:hypothetical protein